MGFKKRAAQAILDDLDIDLAAIDFANNTEITKKAWSIESVSTNIQDARRELINSKKNLQVALGQLTTNQLGLTSEKTRIEQTQAIEDLGELNSKISDLTSANDQIDLIIHQVDQLLAETSKISKEMSSRAAGFWSDGGIGRRRLQHIYNKTSKLLDFLRIRSFENRIFSGGRIVEAASDAKDELENALYRAGIKEPEVSSDSQEVEIKARAKSEYISLVTEAVNWWNSVKGDPGKAAMANNFFQTDQWKKIKALKKSIQSGAFDEAEVDIVVSESSRLLDAYKK